MQLSDQEKDIIACTAFRATLSAAQIGKETGHREHVVRRTISRLQEQGTIVLRPFVNPYALGFWEFHSLITIATPGTEASTALGNAFARASQSTYVAEIGGKYHLSVMFVVRAASEIAAYFESVSAAAPNISFERTLSPVIEMTLYGPKSLSSKKFAVRSVRYGEHVAQETMDELDCKVIEALGESKIVSKVHLARACGVAISTLDYRLKSLERRGILLGIGYMVPAYSDGLASFALQVVASRPSAILHKALSTLAEQQPSVSYLCRTAGAWDYTMGIRLSDPRRLPANMSEIHRALEKHVSRIESIPFYRLLRLNICPVAALDGSTLRPVS